MTHAYGEPSYWDQRYQSDPGTFDWYQKYPSLAPLFDRYLLRHHRLLLVGCGNSGVLTLHPVFLLGSTHLCYRFEPINLRMDASSSVSRSSLGESMVDDGYQDVVNIDISSVVIEAMQMKHMDKQGLKYINMDVRDMSLFQSSSFDAVIDKGTLDSLMCGHDAMQNATKMLLEVDRVLKDKGVYILITYGGPSYRLYMLRSIQRWAINLHVIDRVEKSPGPKTWTLTNPVPLNTDGSSIATLLGSNPEVHYIYVCTKLESQRLPQNETDDVTAEQ
ncbi:unnamed protein product [Musa hybrid cultivar]